MASGTATTAAERELRVAEAIHSGEMEGLPVTADRMLRSTSPTSPGRYSQATPSSSRSRCFA